MLSASRPLRMLLFVLALALGWSQGQAAPVKPPPPTPTMPRLWESLLWGVGMPIKTLGPGSTCPALAALDRQLLLAELFEGGIYLSELDPATASARWTVPVAPAATGVERTEVRAAASGQTVWVAWLEKASGAGPETPRALMMASVDYATRKAQPPTQVAVTGAAALTSHNQQLWLAWLGPAGSSVISLSAGAQDTAFLVPWQPATPAPPVAVGLGDLGADLGIPFLTGEGQGSSSLWLASYNGHRFFGLRKLRGAAELGAPVLCRLQSQVIIVYTVYPDPGEGLPGAAHLEVTVTNTSGSELASNLYLADGRANLTPSLAGLDGTAYLVYNAWSERPDHAVKPAKNLGLFLARIGPPS